VINQQLQLTIGILFNTHQLSSIKMYWTKITVFCTATQWIGPQHFRSNKMALTQNFKNLLKIVVLVAVVAAGAWWTDKQGYFNKKPAADVVAPALAAAPEVQPSPSPDTQAVVSTYQTQIETHPIPPSQPAPVVKDHAINKLKGMDKL
jgi:hypothetical protein